MWVHHSLQVLLLGVALANASPAWFYNTGFENASPSEVGCLSFTKEYDPYTGHITYRCNPDVKKSNYLSDPNRHIGDDESNEDNYHTPEALQSSGRSRNSHSKPMYQSFASERFQMKKNNKPKRPSNSRRIRCPPGQMFQSELDICIDYPLGPPLPPRRPSNSKQTMFDRMVGDAPVRAAVAPASVRTYNLKNRCKPNEIFVSELDICVPKNNCYPYGTSC